MARTMRETLAWVNESAIIPRHPSEPNEMRVCKGQLYYCVNFFLEFLVVPVSHHRFFVKAVLENHQSRDAANLKARGKIGRIVRVDFYYFDPSFILLAYA